MGLVQFNSTVPNVHALLTASFRSSSLILSFVPKIPKDRKHVLAVQNYPSTIQTMPITFGAFNWISGNRYSVQHPGGQTTWRGVDRGGTYRNHQ